MKRQFTQHPLAVLLGVVLTTTRRALAHHRARRPKPGRNLVDTE